MRHSRWVYKKGWYRSLVRRGCGRSRRYSLSSCATSCGCGRSWSRWTSRPLSNSSRSCVHLFIHAFVHLHGVLFVLRNGIRTTNCKVLWPVVTLELWFRWSVETFAIQTTCKYRWSSWSLLCSHCYQAFIFRLILLATYHPVHFIHEWRYYWKLPFTHRARDKNANEHKFRLKQEIINQNGCNEWSLQSVMYNFMHICSL